MNKHTVSLSNTDYHYVSSLLSDRAVYLARQITRYKDDADKHGYELPKHFNDYVKELDIITALISETFISL